MLRTATIIALAGFATAQLGGLSPQCTSALAGIVADPDAGACLQPGSLLSLVTSSNTSIIGPIDNWVTGLCAAAPCSNDTLAAVTRNITSGCQAELGGNETDSSTLANTIIPIVQRYYPTVRKVICLKDGSTNCITETLTDIQNSTGPLTISGIIGMFMSDNAFSNIPRNVTCSNCIKAAYNIIASDIPDSVSDIRPGLEGQCGANFTDGNTPSGITQSAVDTSSSSSGNTRNDSGATALLTSGRTALVLGALSIAVGLL